MKDAQQITCQSSHTCTRDPDAWTTIHQQETMNQHPHAVADHGRKQHPTVTNPRDLSSAIFPTSSPWFKSGKQMHGAFQNHERDFRTSSKCHQSRRGSTAWNTVDDQTVETLRTSHGVRAMRGILRHSVSGISDVDPHGTIGGHPACIAQTGATRDEGQKRNVANLLEAQWVRGKALPRGNRGNPVEEGAERLRPSTECCSERRQRCDVLRTMRDVRESVAAPSPDHGSAGSTDEAWTLAQCSRPQGSALLSTRTREHDDAGHAAAEPLLGMLDVQYHLSLDGCDVQFVDRGSFEGADANMVPIGDDETPCL